jgi:hypothetical protein
MNFRNTSVCVAVLAGLAAGAAPATATAGDYQCTVDISNVTSLDNQGYSGNSRLDVNLGPNATATAAGSSGTLTHYYNSWFCESRVNFTGQAGSDSFALQPYNVCSPGTAGYNYPLTAFPNAITTGPTGKLHMEFFETFNDFGGGGVDGFYGPGSSITVAYTAPAPGSCQVTVAGATTCASEGYTGTQLLWCQNICEKGYTGATLDMWIRRWLGRWRDLPYCAVEQEEPPPQEG